MARVGSVRFKALDKPVKRAAILARCREEDPLDLVSVLVLRVVDVVDVAVREEVISLQVGK